MRADPPWAHAARADPARTDSGMCELGHEPTRAHRTRARADPARAGRARAGSEAGSPRESRADSRQDDTNQSDTDRPFLDLPDVSRAVPEPFRCAPVRFHRSGAERHLPKTDADLAVPTDMPKIGHFNELVQTRPLLTRFSRDQPVRHLPAAEAGNSDLPGPGFPRRRQPFARLTPFGSARPPHRRFLSAGRPDGAPPSTRATA